MDRQVLMQIAASDPQFSRAVDQMEMELARTPTTPEEIAEAIKILEFVLSNPDKYAQVMEAAVADGLIDFDDVPPQFDALFVMSLLAAFYGLEERSAARPYARGGLATAARRVASAGRGADTMLAHINAREAAMLKAMGGSGTVNPTTGLREYKGGFFKNLFKVVVPIALSFIAPGIGTALGLTGAAAGIVGGAVTGALGAGLTGGDPLQGAIMGGLGGGFGKALGSTLAPSASVATQNAIGGGLTGLAGSAITGGNPLLGAAGGAFGGFAGAGGLGNSVSPAVAGGLQTAGNVLASGGSLGQAGLAGLARGAFDSFTGARTDGSAPIEERLLPGQSPSEAVVSGMQRGLTSAADASMSLTGMQSNIPVPGAASSPMLTGTTPQFQLPAGAPQTGGGSFFGGLDTSSALKGLALAGAASSLLGQASPDAQKAVSSLSPEQQAYFNRPNIQWDWNRIQQDANRANLSLDRYLAQYWPQITSGQYNIEVPSGQSQMNMAMGGALTRLARGSGSGRADTINAKLSDGEFVIDAETVALLGDGSIDEGARKLDQMRSEIRRQKGKALAKGKFSPDAKSPLSYLKGAA